MDFRTCLEWFSGPKASLCCTYYDYGHIVIDYTVGNLGLYSRQCFVLSQYTIKLTSFKDMVPRLHNVMEQSEIYWSQSSIFLPHKY